MSAPSFKVPTTEWDTLSAGTTPIFAMPDRSTSAAIHWYGASISTVQDVWNTTPAWSFPHITSALGPTPTEHTFIEQGYAQQVVGLSAYAFLDDMFYFEFGGYRPLSDQTQTPLGINPNGESPISGVAPYWQLAAEKNLGNHSIELGTFGLAAQVLPVGLSQAGTDSFTDVGLDAQYQFLGDPHMVTFRTAGSTRTTIRGRASCWGWPTMPTTRCNP
jgi:hypothetical protein